MAEIEIEPRARGGLLPWLLALALLVLVIWGVTRIMSHHLAAAPPHRGAAAVDTIQDDTPPNLRQYAALAVPRAAA